MSHEADEGHEVDAVRRGSAAKPFSLPLPFPGTRVSESSVCLQRVKRVQHVIACRLRRPEHEPKGA